METIVFDQTPLAEYLQDQGEHEYEYWGVVAEPDASDGPPSPSPSFAPKGRPKVKKSFRDKMTTPLRLDIPGSDRLGSLPARYSKALTSSIDRADNTRFLEQFRYTIVASQLLNGHSILTQQQQYGHENQESLAHIKGVSDPSMTGLIFTAASALILAWMVSWVYSGGYSHLNRKRVLFTIVVLAVAAVLSYAYMRQQWLRYLREQAVREVTSFVSRSQDFDSASSAAITLIQEVELVSRGYRISAPLPPISRMEDQSQTRRCKRLRRALKGNFLTMIQKCLEINALAKSLSEQLELEKYYDIYDISEFDMSDALQGFCEAEFEDPESLRTLKVVAARFHTIRKMFLCALLALGATGDKSDYLRWSTAVEALQTLNRATKESYEGIDALLSEEGTFQTAVPTRGPLSPGRERWRSSLYKLNSLSSGIRGLQAKMTLLREESDRALNRAEDISELGPTLMLQYESIGQDLRSLVHAWEEGKSALASGIDRNEKRLSSISGLLSPTTSLSGLTTVEEGTALDAFKALTGESPPTSSFGSPRSTDHEEIFEAMAMPTRPRSLLTRQERIIKMKEDRDKREVARESSEASKGMLRELEMVINLRPKNRRNTVQATPERISL